MRRFLLLFMACACAAAPVRVLFDTDMGNDIDDALALAVLHALESRGEAKILAVTITKDNKWAAPYVDLVNHFYGRGHIPVGMVKNGKTPQDSNMILLPSKKPYPRKITDGSLAPDAVQLIRRTLEEQADSSVVIVQVGFSTNLARLLDTPGATDLLRRKVRLLSMMAGQFNSPRPEYNVKEDLAAAGKIIRTWPTPIVFSGWEIGDAIRFPASSIQNHFNYVKEHPIADAYRSYRRMPYDRPTWDLTSVLYAVRPGGGYFSLSESGRVSVNAKGSTLFEPSATGTHRYLMIDDLQKTRTLEALIQLASQPPGTCLQ
jgi:inosine-uridine nucleoside N-ribohydrolase